MVSRTRPHGAKFLSDIKSRLKELGIVIPQPPAAIGNFVAGVIHADILYVSGTYGTIKDPEGRDYIPKNLKTGLSRPHGVVSA